MALDVAANHGPGVCVLTFAHGGVYTTSKQLINCAGSEQVVACARRGLTGLCLHTACPSCRGKGPAQRHKLHLRLGPPETPPTREYQKK
eukprot:322322-Amphidinium_carterae.1